MSWLKIEVVDPLRYFASFLYGVAKDAIWGIR